MCNHCQQLYCSNCINENSNCPNCINEINIEWKKINKFEEIQKN